MSTINLRRSALLAVLFLGGALALASAPVFAQDQSTAAASSAPASQASATPPASAAAPATVGPPLQAPTEENVAVKNPYGFVALWKGGDFVSHGIIIILLIMSMGSWYITFTKLFEQFRLLRQAKKTKQFWAAPNVQEGINLLKPGSPFRYIAESGTDASRQHQSQMLEKIDLHTWVTESIQRAVGNVQNSLQTGLAFLAAVGSTAVYIGLFGTVWGIYHALTAIGISGQASIDKVAGPVGEALIMTAIGLAVAVPAVLCYNWLVRRNKVAMDEVRSFSSDLYAVLMAQNAAGQSSNGKSR